jgi:hypothetical protein
VPATPSPSLAPTPSPTLTPTPKPTPEPSPTPDTSGVATRIVITSLKIDLPVVELPASGVTSCNVAMWLNELLFVSPGLPGATYILAYARAGMFLPLLQASQVNNGAAMIGMKVDVYTSADWLFTYQIYAVHRHVATDSHAFDGPRAAKSPELWLQTGEGPVGTPTDLLVAGTLVSANPATPATAQPSPKPVACT